MKFTVLYGSHRPERRGIHLANYMVECLKARGHDVTLLDSKVIDLPILELRHSDYDLGKAPQKLEDIATTLNESDAFIIVSGEYNSSVQPGLKNLMDHFYSEYRHRPVTFALYSVSPFGGRRVSSHMIQLANAYGMVPIPDSLNVPLISKVFDDKGQHTDEKLDVRASIVIQSLEWYARALKAERDKEGEDNA